MASGHSDDTSPADTPAASAKDGQQPPAEAGAAAKLSQELQPPVVTTGAAAESPPPAGAGAANIAAPRQEPQTRKQPSVMLPAETQDDSGPEAPAERAKSQSRRSASLEFESRSKSRRLRASSSRRQPRDSRRHSEAEVTSEAASLAGMTVKAADFAPGPSPSGVGAMIAGTTHVAAHVTPAPASGLHCGSPQARRHLVVIMSGTCRGAAFNAIFVAL